MALRFLLAIAATCVLASCTSTDHNVTSDPEFGPVERLSDNPGAIDGIWQSRGYGWVFEINGDQLTQYQITSDTCFATPEVSKPLSETLSLDYQLFRPAETGDQAILQLLPDDTEIRIDRIDQLPAACREKAARSKQDTFDYFAAMMAEHYAFFDIRQIDWNSRVAHARTQLDNKMTDDAFFDLLASMIDGFSDSHTKLIANIDGKVRRQQDGLGQTLSTIRAADQETPWLVGLFSGLQENVLDEGSVHTANDRILWGMIDGRIGYIQVLVMGGFSGIEISDPEFRSAEFEVFDTVLDRALAKMASADFVILDLSNNRGGYDAISRRLVARFAEVDTIAYRAMVPRSGIEAKPRYARAEGGVRYTGPVLLLTSDVTVSGGELATLGLRALPNVMQMGGTTRGSFSTVLAKPLPNGWVVELSNEVISGPDGEVYEETGIAPDVALEMFPLDDPVGGYFRALNKAIRLMDADTAKQGNR